MNRPASPVAWIFPVALHGLLGLGLFLRLLLAGPSYDRLFRDFNMALPAVTLVTFQLVRFLGDYWYLFAPTALGALAVDGLLLAWLGGWARPGGRWLFWGVGMLLLGAWVLAEVSWLLPYLKLLEGLSR